MTAERADSQLASSRRRRSRLAARDHDKNGWVTSLSPAGLPATEAAAQRVDEVLAALAASSHGLTSAEAASRLISAGPNAVRTHHVQALAVLGRQLRSAILALLLVTATVSFFLGDQTDSVIIAVILIASVGLGFVNEYAAERTADALHSGVQHTATVLRDGIPVGLDVTVLVPGDVVRLGLGQVVPADLRLLEVSGLECDESLLTGESVAVAKAVAPVPAGTGLADLTCCALMGTVVQSGAGTGVVVATGGLAEFGRIALGLGERQPETDFQQGLRRFSVLLLQVAVALTVLILVTNLALRRPLIDSLLFSLAIAVGITPQLLPAVVSSSLATGSRQLARRKVLVKRLVCIEDLGDMDVLVTDKTGTLTQGRISLTAALAPDGSADDRVLTLGLLATGTDPSTGEPGSAGANPMDEALWAAVGPVAATVRAFRQLGLLPFDHHRMLTSALVSGPDGGRLLVTKGAPETVLDRCLDVPPSAHQVLEEHFVAGGRVVAVASKDASGLADPAAPAAPAELGPDDEHGLTLTGFLIFLDAPKPAAAQSLELLHRLGVQVKIATGDNAAVAAKVCADLGLRGAGGGPPTALTGSEIADLDDDALADAAMAATIFARVSPEQKARIVRLLRRGGRAVGFLGDGVNDALALHAADVGISVDTATDVAKDAADIILLEKDLGVLADGVADGRRIFANTIKYVLMGTSSNFGNMFSAAAASAVLPFLPMLPGQILLNNLLYDSSQLAIPTDRVDAEQLRAPAHWDIAFIRRFMMFFGPISSMFDFLTFAVMLGVFSAGPGLFRSGWFIESLATQTLIIFAIRTRRVPFFRSTPSLALTVAALTVVAIGIALPSSPLAGLLGFTEPPLSFFAALAGMVVAYLVLIEVAKRIFFADPQGHIPGMPRRRGRTERIQRRAGRYSVSGPLPG